MKISTAPISRFLTQQDLPAPLVLTMERVTRDESLHNPDVLHFAADQVKPLPLNLTNIRSIVAAYGDETGAWSGKGVEVYADASVTDSKGKRTGGVRIRVPAITAITARSAPRPIAPTAPAPPPTAPKPTAPAAATAPKPAQPPTLAQRHAQLLAGYAGARTQDKVREWAQWGTGFPWTPEMDDEQSDAFHAAMERTAPPPEHAPARRTAPARA